jgi:hypothetical protein
MIVVEVELPVEKVLSGRDIKRVAEDRCSTMRGRTQPDYMGTDRDRLVVTVLCPVIESNLYDHPPSWATPGVSRFVFGVRYLCKAILSWVVM